MNELLFNTKKGAREFRMLRITGDSCDVNLFSPYNNVSLDYHQAKKLINWLDDWVDEQRSKCGACQHERSGCQYHDGDE